MEFLNPPGFAPPLHRHRVEEEMFAILDGEATFFCAGERLATGPDEVVLLPAGLPHSLLVGPAGPPRTLQITTPGGFEAFAAAVGTAATERRLPEPGPVDPAAPAHAADLHVVDILGSPPTR